jgi:SAM-dependent methyltransferase
MIAYSEAEIQVLIALIELSQPKETPNNNFYTFYPKNLDEAARYFKRFRVDWIDAYPLLLAKGLIVASGDGYALTDQGKVKAIKLRDARPPIYYWYKEYYTLTADSPAYAEFCRQLYGENLRQANFSDMDQLNKLIEILALDEESLVLDLGCGAGTIAEYISDLSGARFVGIDYCPEAIQQALERNQSKRDRLSFRVGNMDDLDLPPHAFDAVISIDTLYMPNDLDATLRKVIGFMKPRGQMAVFFTHMIWGRLDERPSLLPENTPLAAAFKQLGLTFHFWDFTPQTYLHMQKKHRIGAAMRPTFEAEGHLAIYDYIMSESESSTSPYDPDSYPAARYLYHIKL